MSQDQSVRHILIVEDPKYRRTVNLENEVYLIGRHSSNSIVLYSQQVSRYHATLTRKQDQKNNNFYYWITDGNLDGQKSQNGIYINSKKVLKKQLIHGDLIRFCSEAQARYYVLENCPEFIFDLEFPPNIKEKKNIVFRKVLLNIQKKIPSFN